VSKIIKQRNSNVTVWNSSCGERFCILEFLANGTWFQSFAMPATVFTEGNTKTGNVALSVHKNANRLNQGCSDQRKVAKTRTAVVVIEHLMERGS
jgi:hypothetical protein